jgi:hypothetical protein
MSNYLRGLGQAVGFTDDTKSRGPHAGQGGNEWDVVSHASSQGGVNFLNRARGLGQGQPPGGGDWAIGDTFNDGNPAQWDRQQPGEGRGELPRAVNRDNALKIQSNVFMGEGYDPRGRREGQEQHQAAHPPGGGIAAQLQRATTCNADATIEKELDWQARVGGDATKATTFRDQALGQQTFRVFTFIKGKSPVIHMAHSVGTFLGMSGLVTNVQGKQIAFVGEQGNGRYPVPFILPPQNSWTWTKTCYLRDTARFGKFYCHANNQDKLWVTGATEYELTDQQLLRFLALPTFVAEFLVQQGGVCLPHNLRNFVTTHIDGGDSQVPPEK